MASSAKSGVVLNPVLRRVNIKKYMPLNIHNKIIGKTIDSYKINIPPKTIKIEVTRCSRHSEYTFPTLKFI